ncbi:GNAT family N-acetyltransferase [Pseudomonas corrugata]
MTYFGKDRRFAVLVYLSSDGDTVAWGALKPFSARPDDETMAEVAVYVRRDMRARGVGIRLLQALEVSAREAGFESLVAIILGPNHASARGCKSQGFAECVRIPRIARLENNLVDIVWLQKKWKGMLMVLIVDESYQLGTFRDNEDSLRRLKSQAGIALDLEFDHLRQAGLTQGQRVLDVGCGPGIITTQIALRAQPSRLTALDCNETSISETRKQLSNAGIDEAQVRQCNLYDDSLTDPGQFDFSYARMVFQHLSDPLSALRNIHRSLAIGGRLCICDIDDRWFGASPQPPELQSFLARVARAQAARGGDRHVGSKLASYLEETATATSAAACCWCLPR